MDGTVCVRWVCNGVCVGVAVVEAVATSELKGHRDIVGGVGVL